MNAKSIVSVFGSARNVSTPGAMRSSMRSATPARSHARRATAVHSSDTSQHSSRPSVGEPAGDAQRRVAGERSDLDCRARADEPREQREERTLLGCDLHPGHRTERARLFDERELHLVGR